MIISSKEVHSLNDDSQIETTDDGITTFSNDEHLKKTNSFIFVTDDGIDISDNDEHSPKANLSIFFNIRYLQTNLFRFCYYNCNILFFFLIIYN